jgi:hypothetical protein
MIQTLLYDWRALIMESVIAFLVGYVAGVLHSGGWEIFKRGFWNAFYDARARQRHNWHSTSERDPLGTDAIVAAAVAIPSGSLPGTAGFDPSNAIDFDPSSPTYDDPATFVPSKIKKFINWEIIFWPPIVPEANTISPIMVTYYRSENPADVARWTGENFAALAKGQTVAEITIRDPDNKFAPGRGLV